MTLKNKGQTAKQAGLARKSLADVWPLSGIIEAAIWRNPSSDALVAVCHPIRTAASATTKKQLG